LIAETAGTGDAGRQHLQIRPHGPRTAQEPDRRQGRDRRKRGAAARSCDWKCKWPDRKSELSVSAMVPPTEQNLVKFPRLPAALGEEMRDIATFGLSTRGTASAPITALRGGGASSRGGNIARNPG